MDVGASFNRALEKFKPNWLPLIVGMLIAGISMVVLQAIPNVVISMVLEGGFLAMLVTTVVGAAIAMAVWGPIYGGMMTMVGKAYMGAQPQIGDVAAAVKSGRLKEFIVVGAVIQAPGLIPFIGGLGVLITTFLFFPALIMVAEGTDAKTALSQSKAMVMGSAKDWFITYLVGGLISLFFITAPLGMLFIIDHYFQKKGAQPAATGIQPMQQYAAPGADPYAQQQYGQPQYGQQPYAQPQQGYGQPQDPSYPQGGGYPPQGGGWGQGA